MSPLDHQNERVIALEVQNDHLRLENGLLHKDQEFMRERFRLEPWIRAIVFALGVVLGALVQGILL